MQENKDPMKNLVSSLIKKKIWLFIAPALPVVFFFLILSTFILVMFYPVLRAGQIVSGASGFWSRLTNAITLKCLFCTDEQLENKKEQKFYDKVEKLNETYLKGTNMGGTSIQLDIPLLLSAILYTPDIEEIFEAEETSNTGVMGEATSGDGLFSDLAWYPASGDQESIDWYEGPTEAAGCYPIGYNYYETPIQQGSKLRQLAKHMVRRVMKGACYPRYKCDKEGNCHFSHWEHNEWPEWKLSIEPNNELYTMEFDQEPYKSYRTVAEFEESPSSFITFLISTYLPKKFPNELPPEVRDLSEEHQTYLSKRKSMQNDIYELKSAYEYFTEGNNSDYYCGELNGSCNYTVNSKGKEVTVSNLKVKLLQCADGNRGDPIEGEELVDFEKYITGVVYQEIGGAPYEALKAEAIAARSFALSRNKAMGVSYLQIYKENGQWILPIRNCTEDQVYCDPDEGCTIKNGGENSSTVYSGNVIGKSGYSYKPGIAADSDIRKAVAETTGKVLVDKKGDIVYTPYTNTEHNVWKESANSGNDAYQILVGTYGSSNVIKSSCTGNVGTTINSGSQKYYNQEDYAYVPYCSAGNTVATSGGLPTVFAMVTENLTGKVTTPQNIAEYICKDTNGSKKYYVEGSETSSGFLLDSNVQSDFNISVTNIALNNRSINNISETLKSGKNIIAFVKGSGSLASEEGNYIILSSVTPEGRIKVLDPSRRYKTGDYVTSDIQKEVLDKTVDMWEVSSTSGTIENNYNGCYTGATGDYLSWKQKDKTWSGVSIGSEGKTIGEIGCLATSVAKLITMSGTQVTISSFNPGTMVKYLNTHGGFSGSNWIWSAPKNSGLAPNFVYGGSVKLAGMSKEEKVATVKRYLDQGYYLVLQVGCEGTEQPNQHWVAVLATTNEDIIMSDPESNNRTVWSKYKPGGTVKFHYYKKTD